MHTQILTLPTQHRHIGIDAAIGQIDMLGGSGEVVRSWRIQSPKCTLGSGPECSVQIDAKKAAPLHATLVFGKKHTLLRAIAPVRIADRNVREWLIDHPTEILIGDCRLVVHPSIGVMATVVQAEHLIDLASRLCKDPSSLVTSTIIQAAVNPTPETTFGQPPEPTLDLAFAAAPTPVAETPAAIDLSANLASIERLLLSLQDSLERVQESLAVESKQSRESIENAVTTEFDAFGKTWFTSLSGQLQNQSDVQQSLLSNLSDQFTGRFGAIDEHLHRFTEASSQNTSSLNDLLEQARGEHSSIEARFQELVSQRDELKDALQVLRTEIAFAFDQSLSASNAAYNAASNALAFQPNVEGNYFEQPSYSEQPQTQYDPDSSPFESSDLTTSESDPSRNENALDDSQEYVREYGSEYAFENDQEFHDATDGQQGQFASDTSTPFQPVGIQDEQLAESLERAQLQIQHYNQQLKAAESELDIAHQRISELSESLGAEQAIDTPAIAEQFDKIEFPPDLDSSYAHTSESSYELAEESNYDHASQKSYEQAVEPNFGETIEENAIEEDPLEPNQSKLPAWFMVDESPHTNADSVVYPQPMEVEEQVSTSFSTTGADNDSEPDNQESQEHQTIPSEIDSTAMSERLQRMLMDAEGRRRSSNTPSEPNTSLRWSESFGSKPISSENLVHAETPSMESDDLGEAEEPNFLQEEDLTPETENDAVPIETNGLARKSPPHHENSGTAEEESIEEYMQRLLHRVRGTDILPATVATLPPTKTSVATKPSGPGTSRIVAPASVDSSGPISTPDVVEPLTNESFVPRQQAPEHRDELDALRELANSNARRALSRSDNRRMNSAFFFKLGVTGVAAFSAAAIFLLNGLALNMSFVGMIAAVVVGFLWGYDCLTHFKQLQNDSQQIRDSTPRSASMNAIQIGSTDGVEDRWRPSAS